MDALLNILRQALIAEGFIIMAAGLFLFATSLQEKEDRPAFIALVLTFLLSLPFLLPFLFSLSYPVGLVIGLNSLLVLPVLILLLPVRGLQGIRPETPRHRFDERDTMFSRKTLVPGTDRFNEYYARRPEHKIPDNQFRKKPGLLKAGTRYYDPILFATAQSLFDKTDQLHPRVEGPVAAADRSDLTGITETLLEMAIRTGAHSAGITKLRDYHVYRVGGRGDRYGKSFRVEHSFAIALTVEMDHDMMRAAPAAPTVVESARQYFHSGLIAVHLAEFIRALGYPARAHIDGNYQVICPLVARDAGLGVIGRMGLLMTPRLGPRCRIAVVTTDLPLEHGTLAEVGRRPHRPAARGRHVQAGLAAIEFCRHCKKCARICPARSIPFGPEKEIQGVRRWKIHSESCYTYWCQAGTDCGRCMIACPYAHPDKLFHRIIRFGIRNNVLFRRLAVALDDWFYGKKPRSRPV